MSPVCSPLHGGIHKECKLIEKLTLRSPGFWLNYKGLWILEVFYLFNIELKPNEWKLSKVCELGEFKLEVSADKTQNTKISCLCFLAFIVNRFTFDNEVDL